MRLSKKVAMIAFVGFLYQPVVFAAGDYAMLAEAVSRLIETSKKQSLEISEFKDKIGTLDEFNKKRQEDKVLLERMDGDITKLLMMQSQLERVGNDNKLASEDINKLIREVHEVQQKLMLVESMQGDTESRRLAEKAARIDQQAYNLQGIVAKRDLDLSGGIVKSDMDDMTNGSVKASETATNVKKNKNKNQGDALDIDILR